MCEEILSSAGKWREVENIILSEVIQTPKNRRSIYSLISVYNNKKKVQNIQDTAKKTQEAKKKVNKLKGPSEDASIPQEEKKAIMWGRKGREKEGGPEE